MEWSRKIKEMVWGKGRKQIRGERWKGKEKEEMINDDGGKDGQGGL